MEDILPPPGFWALIAALLLLLLISGCESPFERTGPKFNARAPSTAKKPPTMNDKVESPAVTNVTTLELTNRVAQEWLEPGQEPFTLGPGDKIEIEILGDASTRTIVNVGPDGKIYFYLLPGLDVWGLTIGQMKELLERELAKYMAGAQVAVTLRAIESKRIWLLGRLHNSGVYPVGAPMTLLESISMAGGLLSPTNPGSAGGDEVADLQHSFIIRQGQLLPVDFHRLIRQGDMTQNIYLRPDDFVYVPSAVTQDIYVLGAIRNPKPVAALPSTTLISAIANAGGTLKDAYLSHVGIVRGSMSQPKIAVVNYKDIVSGRAPDVRLESRDIVYVPFSPYRNLVKYANLILDTFARAVAINEGARAASHDAAPVGVNIGIGVH